MSRVRDGAFGVGIFVATVVVRRLLRPADRGDLRARAAAPPDRPAGRPDRARRTRADRDHERDRARGHPARRHARGLLPRNAALPWPGARDHARRAAPRTAAHRGRHRTPGGVRRPHRPALGHPRSAQDQRRLHHHRRRACDLLRGRAVLRAPGDRVVRDARQGHPRRRPRRRGEPAAPASEHQHPAGLDRPGRRRRAGLRARHRRVRGDDHVRRQPARRHADAAPADLPGLRAQLRRRARHRRAARDRQRGRPDRGQAARSPARQGAQRQTARSSSALSGPAADGVSRSRALRQQPSHSW